MDARSEPPGGATMGQSGWIESVLEAAFDGIFLFGALRSPEGDIEDLRFVVANAGGARLWGATPDDLVGARLGERFPGTRDVGFLQDLVRVIETGRRLETQFYYDAEGLRSWFRASGVRIGDCVALTLRDITDDVEKEQALQQREQHLRFITSTSRDILSFHAANGDVRWVSDACRELLGYEPAQLVGSPPLDLVHPDDRRIARSALEHLTVGGREEALTARFKRKDGRYIWLQCLGRPVTDPMGTVTGFMLNTREVQEQVENHQALERALKDLQRANEALTLEKRRSEAAAEAKTRFLATMSHEIRTPLNGIIGVLSLLERESFPERIGELMDTLHASGTALLSIVNDILDFSKIEAGEVQVEKRAFDPHGLINDVALLFRTGAEANGVALEHEISPRVPRSIVSDRSRLRQILFNLTSNAVKFTPKGRITLRADFDPQRDTLLIEVADTGIGISPEALKTIFRPFSQADVSTTRKYGGTGLGLAIVSSLTKLLDGSLTVSSEPKKGTRFRIALHIEQWDDNQAFSDDVSFSGSMEDLVDPKPLRILLVEDNAVNRKVAATMVKRLGHQVELAEDGLEAIERLATGHFDLVLMDLQMPRLDGLEATRRIRKSHGARLPIIALTANAFESDREACLAAGMDGHLSKPLRLADLERALTTIQPS